MARSIRRRSRPARRWLGCVSCLRSLWAARSPSPGSRPGPCSISDVDVVVQRVAGQVVGVRADLAKLQGSAFIDTVRVHAGDVDSGGAVTGVDLT